MDETLIKKLTAIVESQKQLEDDLSKVDISSDPINMQRWQKNPVICLQLLSFSDNGKH